MALQYLNGQVVDVPEGGVYPMPPPSPPPSIADAVAPTTEVPAATTPTVANAVFPSQQGSGPPPGTLSPPQTPEEHQQRVAGWTKVFNAIAENPQISSMLLRTGISLMQPVPPGQNTLGHIGQAFNVGLTALEASKFQEERTRQAQSEEERKAIETEAQAGEARARTKTELERPDLVRAQVGLTQQQADRINSERDLITAQIRQSNSHSDLFDTEARLKQLEHTYKVVFGPDEARAKINVLKEQSGYYAAYAKYAEAHADQARAAADANKENWTTVQSKDDNGNMTYFSTNHKNGLRQQTRIIVPLSESEAIAKAKQDVATARDRMPKWGGLKAGESEAAVSAQITGNPDVKTLEQAQRVLVERYKKGGIFTTTIESDGTVKSTTSAGEGGVSAPGPTAAPKYTNVSPGLSPAEQASLTAVEQAGTTPANIKPLADKDKALPVGTKAKEGDKWWEVMPGGIMKEIPDPRPKPTAAPAAAPTAAPTAPAAAPTAVPAAPTGAPPTNDPMYGYGQMNDINRYTRTKKTGYNNRGVPYEYWDYTQSGRGSGKTKAEWQAQDAAGR